MTSTCPDGSWLDSCILASCECCGAAVALELAECEQKTFSVHNSLLLAKTLNSYRSATRKGKCVINSHSYVTARSPGLLPPCRLPARALKSPSGELLLIPTLLTHHWFSSAPVSTRSLHTPHCPFSALILSLPMYAAVLTPPLLRSCLCSPILLSTHHHTSPLPGAPQPGFSDLTRATCTDEVCWGRCSRARWGRENAGQDVVQPSGFGCSEVCSDQQVTKLCILFLLRISIPAAISPTIVQIKESGASACWVQHEQGDGAPRSTEAGRAPSKL